MLRRVPPLAIAIALVAAGLVATAWSTRSAVNDAFEAVRDGQAFAVQQAVRADLADLGGPPSSDDLAAIIQAHANEGLAYLAMLDGRGRVRVSAGTSLLDRPGRGGRTGLRVDHVGDRVAFEMRQPFRRAWGPGRGAIWVAMEIEPPEAKVLRSAAQRTLSIGALGALVLLGFA